MQYYLTKHKISLGNGALPPMKPPKSIYNSRLKGLKLNIFSSPNAKFS